MSNNTFPVIETKDEFAIELPKDIWPLSDCYSLVRKTVYTMLKEAGHSTHGFERTRIISAMLSDLMMETSDQLKALDK